ncbi:MAG: hypothetical protein EOO03_10460 [Chitinophagaceae bacterium]|nr:MAG: hypothetical protein EOO03_10460 [Chitinophagaceae bacterium]
MKLEQLIVQYLYNNKSVTLQDIGTFTLSPNVVIPADSDKETMLPIGSIEFEYNNRAPQDEGLIDFIVQQSRKIKPLATSDLESYSLLSRQFLNIGKPMIIEGIGTLQKSQEGVYEFTQGNTINPKLENQPVTIKEKAQDEITFSTPAKESSGSKTGLLIVAALVILGTLAAIYYFLIYSKADEVPVPTETPVLMQDTLSTPTVDSSMLSADTTSRAMLNGMKDTAGAAYNFAIVFKEYKTKAEADKALARYSSFGHKVQLHQTDSALHKLFIPFAAPITDTARAKDSLKVIFGGQPYIAF